MDLLIKDLVPGQTYVLQARARSGNTTSEWSTQYTFTTTTDLVAPGPVTGLTWAVSGSSFVGTWTKPALDGDGKPLLDFTNYKVVLTAASTSITYYVVEPRFNLSFAANLATFGSAQPVVQISVQAQDNVGNLSSAVTLTATNAAPAAVTNFVVTGTANSLQVGWDASAETDFSKFELYLATTSSGFTPGPSNLVYSGPGTSFVYPTSNNTAFFLKIRQLDVFGQASTYVSGTATPTFPTNIDTSAPAVPTGVTVSTAAASDGSSNINVSWTAVTSTNLRNYVVRYSLDQVTWQYITVPAAAISTVINTLNPGTAYYVGVAAVSYVNTYSSYANAGTYPITTATDTTAPSTPDTPTVSSNMQAVQVSHTMKKAGGTVNLEADTDYLEVHGSATTSFTPTSATLVGFLQSGGPGITTSAIFPYGVSNAVTNVFWKVIAVDKAKNKSTASAQATALPGLIQGINIASATITDANINDLNANKITAGTGFINNLTVNSIFTLGASGHMRSSDYSAGTQGWSLDTTGLFIYEGNISAGTLLLQNSANICPSAFADFEFLSTYYHDASNLVNTVTSSADSGVLLQVVTSPFVGTQALRIFNASLTFGSSHKYFFAPGGLTTAGINILVDPGTYIFSLRAKKNGTPVQFIKLSAYTDTGTALQVASQTVSSTSYVQFSGTLVVPGGAQKVKMYLELGPNSGSTGYDIVIDAMQFERQIGALSTPSPWTRPGNTAIDGGSIVTGSIQSSAASATIVGQPAWSINTAGNMQIGDALIRGSLIVGSGSENSYVRANTYSAGVAGWTINADGSVEFNNGTFRGNLNIANTINSQMYDLIINNQSIVTRLTDPQTTSNTYSLSGTSPTIWFQGYAQQKTKDPFGTWAVDASAPIQSVVRLDANGFLQILNDPVNSTDIFSIDSNYSSSSNTNKINKYYSYAASSWGSIRQNPIAYNPPGKAVITHLSSANFKDSAGGATKPKMAITSQLQASADASSGIWYNTVSKNLLSSGGYYNFTSNNKIRQWFDNFTNAGGATFYQTNTTIANLSATFSIGTNQFAAGSLTSNSLVLTASGATEPRQITFANPLAYDFTGLVAGTVLRLSVWCSCSRAGAQIKGGFSFNNSSTVMASAWGYINNEATHTAGNLVGQPYHYLNQFVVTVPAGATAAVATIQFQGLTAADVISITAISAGTASDDQDGVRFAPTTLADNLSGSATIQTVYSPYPNKYPFAAASLGPAATANFWNGTNQESNANIISTVTWQDSTTSWSSQLTQTPNQFKFSAGGILFPSGNGATVVNSGNYYSVGGVYFGSPTLASLGIDIAGGANVTLQSGFAGLQSSSTGSFLNMFSSQVILAPSTTGGSFFLQQDPTDTLISNGTHFSMWSVINGSMTNTSDKGWQAISPGNSWIASGAYATPAYMLMPDGIVRMRGALINGTKTDGTILFTLAAGFRPAAQVSGVAVGATNGTFVGVLIQTNGNVLCEGIGTNGNFVGLDNISFPVNV